MRHFRHRWMPGILTTWQADYSLQDWRAVSLNEWSTTQEHRMECALTILHSAHLRHNSNNEITAVVGCVSGGHETGTELCGMVWKYRHLMSTMNETKKRIIDIKRTRSIQTLYIMGEEVGDGGEGYSEHLRVHLSCNTGCPQKGLNRLLKEAFRSFLPTTTT